MLDTAAGRGDHHYFLLKSTDADKADNAGLEAFQHYLGVDAVRWYVNKQSNILKDRMASGTVQVGLAGNEVYEVGLGTYELKGGARTAPVFARPILPNRVFQGGAISLKTFVRTMKQDTLLGGLLRDMSKASLEVVSGAIGAATATGPLPMLVAAGMGADAARIKRVPFVPP